MTGFRYGLILCAVLVAPFVCAQGLETKFDARGLAHLAYQGVVLVDLDAGIGDPFSVGAYKLGARDGWGGNEKTANWDSAAKIIAWRWTWGSVSCQFLPRQERMKYN